MKTKVAATERKARARKIIARLKREYPDATCALHHQNALELVVATILSAQCTDARVNMVTPHLFAKYRAAADSAVADPRVLEKEIQSTGFFRNKTKSIIGMAQALVERHGGEVPKTMEDLTGSDGDCAARLLDLVFTHADPARPRRLHRAPPEVRRLRHQPAVPELAGMRAPAPVDRDSLVAIRRDIHQHPELGFEETRTANLITERLRGLNYQVTPGIGKTGVVGLKGNGGRCVLLRADMDALPVEEANAVPYRSRETGKMHACGHDGHVAIGLEVARRLAPLELAGSVKFAFQPAEEVSNGAQAMINDGVLDKPKVDAAFGIHLWNDLPVGTIGIMAGPMMASVDLFEIEVLGRGGHAAAPHQTIDPVLVAAHVVTALQSLVSRRRDPLAEAVVSVTEVHAGRAFNVIPARADLRGTVRTFGGSFWDEAPRLVAETAQGIAAAFGG